MRKFLGFLLLALLSSPSLAYSLGLNLDLGSVLEEKLKANAGHFIDEILSNLRAILLSSGYDKLQLPDANTSFSKSFLGVTWRGDAAAYDGILRGMETIHRVGAASLDVTDKDFVFSADLGFDDVTVTYDLKARFMGYGPTAKVTGKFKNINCFLEAKTSKANPGNVELTKLNIHDIGELTFDIKGLGFILNYVAEWVAGVLGNAAKHRVADLVENNIKELLNNVIHSTKFKPDMFAL